MSNIWESMQRGLEKASHEAARIGRIQRLRSTIDNLSRQLTTQNNLLVTRTMEVFTAGQMTQSELLPVCQDLAILRQQLDQAQHELKLLLNQGSVPPQSPQTGQTPTGPNPITGGEIAPTVPIPLMPSVQTAPPPPGYSTVESTMPVPVPPPPPGVQPPTVSALDTLLLNTNNPLPPPPPGVSTAARCLQCQAELIPGNAYCPNCGTHIESSAVQHLPTVRSGFYPTGQETMDSEATGTEPPTVYTSETPQTPPPPPHVADLETVRGALPAQEPEDQQARDGGQ